MILRETLKRVVKLQQEDLESADPGIPREILGNIDMKIPHAVILSGVRRCGKSTLLRQMIRKTGKSYYFNFEDQRTLGFDARDFEKLDAVLREEHGDPGTYFLDEIQNIPGWERFVRSAQDSGRKFVITGSNASLLSRELGTRLTGRHITHELFPFSYTEALRLTSGKPSQESLRDYMKTGGFPEFLKYGKTEILQELLKDVISRDIITRYGLREARTLREMAIYLLSNTGKEFSYTNLGKHFNLGSTNTAISYVSYLEDSYLIFTIPRFDYSYRKQAISPKKAYSIDVGLSRANSASFSDDKGRVLENIVFLALRRAHKDIFYYRGNKECDFLVKDRGKLKEAIQVCYELTDDNKERELSGLKEAMKELKISKGTLITLDHDDILEGISVWPAWKWLLEYGK